MLCASTKANITASTGRTPGSRNTRRTLCWRPASWPGKSGTCQRTQPSSSTDSADMIRKAGRQPTLAPSSVPAGMPSDSASGAPSIATAMARPCCCGATMRAACPASSAHSRPANTPAKKRATSVSV
ncbi:hypothetical protein D9M68_832280 [compost metagenome]